MQIWLLVLSVLRAHPGGQLQTLKTQVGWGILFGGPVSSLSDLSFPSPSDPLAWDDSVSSTPSSPFGLVQMYPSPTKPCLQWHVKPDLKTYYNTTSRN